MNNPKFTIPAVLLLAATTLLDPRWNGWRQILPFKAARYDLELRPWSPVELRLYQFDTRLTGNSWRGLLPLKSTRADVEKLLGVPSGSLAGSYSYESKEEKVRVLYSEGSCKPSLEGKWNVPSDTVLSITVFPKKTVLVSSLQLDKEIYKRSQEVHPANWAWYVSLEKGVMVHVIQTNGCEEVMSITYRPSTKDENYRCSQDSKIP